MAEELKTLKGDGVEGNVDGAVRPIILSRFGSGKVKPLLILVLILLIMWILKMRIGI